MACLAVMAFSAMSAKMSQFTFVEVCYTHVCDIVEPFTGGLLRSMRCETVKQSHNFRTILHMKLVDVSRTALEADRSVSVPMGS